MRMGAHMATIVGDSGNDTLTGTSGDDSLEGLEGNDSLIGADGSDYIRGDEGDDTIVAGAGNDTIQDYQGANSLDGGDGDDLFYDVSNQNGPPGADTITGGAGRDTYSFDTFFSSLVLVPDVITDFATGPGGDILTITRPDITNFLTGFSAGSNPFSEGYFRLLQNSADTLLQIDYDGPSGNANFVTVLTLANTTATAFTADNFQSPYNYDPQVTPGISFSDDDSGNTLPNSSGPDTLLGNGGNDTISGADGSDSISGGDDDDSLSGDAGADTLDGGSGNDTLLGGDDNDIFMGFVGADSVDGGNGSDTIVLTATSSDLNDAAYGQIVNVEQVTATDALSAVLIDLHNQAGWFAIYGSNFDDTLIGTDSGDYLGGGVGNDSLVGNGGDDQLYGDAGADTMAGGQGNDQYIVDNVDDQVIELPGEGSLDAVLSTISYTLPANVENMFLFGPASVATGNELNNDLEGGLGNDTLVGLDGNDYLFGYDGDDSLIGGAGDDTLNGGAGNDTVEYSGNQTDYVVTDNPDGTHTIQDLRAGSPDGTDLLYSIEHVVFLGGGSVDFGDGNQSLVGGPGNDTLTGGPGNDTIEGGDGDDLLLGGAGNDSLDGGPGNDTLAGEDGANSLRGGTGDDSYYLFDNLSDAIIELAGEGTDTVETSAPSFTLPDNVEDLVRSFGAGGPQDFVGTGNSLDNFIQGASANDTLIGLDGNDTLYGRDGADSLVGGLGDDLYLDYNTASAIYEAAGEGIDTVYTSLAAYTLPDNVEILIYAAQSGDFAGTGNSSDNLIGGTGGADTLLGLGGNDTLGGNDNSDFLGGGAGDDSLRGDDGFDTAIYTGAWSDYTISLSDSVFTIIDSRAGSPDGTDSVTGVENFQFSDGTRTATELFNSPPTAVADAATALEASGANNATPGSNPTGNVLTNDTDPDSGETKTVQGVAAGSPTGPLSTGVGSAISGSFGALVLNADGSYAYTLDNTNSAVEALNVGAHLTDTFTYTMHDAAGAASTSTLSITINGADDAPTQVVDNNAATNSVAENAANGALVGITAFSTDVDGGALIYSLTDDAGGRFTINASTGIVSVANGALLDFETAASHNIMVQISDGTLTNSQSFTIAVTNVSGVTITGTPKGDIIDATHTVAGQPLPTGEEDTINGNNGNDNISGLGGNDSLNGAGGADTLIGGDGNDTLDGGAGTDQLVGGLGDDTYIVGNAADALIEGVGQGIDTVKTALASFTLGPNFEHLIYIGAAKFKGTGNGLDNLITGGAGDDTLTGGGGADTVTGGAGADHFVYGPGDFAAGPAFDEITDFSHAQGDRISLVAIDANSNTPANETFVFIGANAFTHAARQLHYVVNGSGGVNVEGDTNGDGVADFHITVDGVASLAAGDFML